jgi:hypothetical protein
LLVVRHGYLVYERYFGKGNREAHLDMASIRSSILSPVRRSRLIRMPPHSAHPCGPSRAGLLLCLGLAARGLHRIAPPGWYGNAAVIQEKLAGPMGFGTWSYAIHRNGNTLPHTPGGGSIALRATDAVRSPTSCCTTVGGPTRSCALRLCWHGGKAITLQSSLADGLDV